MLFGIIPLITFSLVLLVTFAPVLVFSAADLGNPLDSRIIINLMKGFVQSVIYVATPALVVFIVWVGFLFVSASGNPAGIQEARKMGTKALLGGAVLLSLWVIITIVGNTLAGLSAAALLIVLAGFFMYVMYKT